jgi:hypothetical protein
MENHVGPVFAQRVLFQVKNVSAVRTEVTSFVIPEQA